MIGESSDSLVTVRITNQNDSFDLEALHRRLPSDYERHGVRFVTSTQEQADIVLVFNYLKYDSRVSARDGYIFRWDKEPVVRNPCPKGYDRIFTHVDVSCAGRKVTAPPVMDWWVKKTWDELHEMSVPEKTELASMIASTKVAIPGHRKRNSFADRLTNELPEVVLYGHGRDRELADKWEGLNRYRYSITVENTSKPDYWTEKVADCFLAFTVPIYFGATNLDEYFPEDSFVWLPLDDPEKAISVVREELAANRWESRLPALIEARQLVLEKYSLGSRIATLVSQERSEILSRPITTKRVHGRRVWRKGWIRGVSARKNIRQMVKRFLPARVHH